MSGMHDEGRHTRIFEVHRSYNRLAGSLLQLRPAADSMARSPCNSASPLDVSKVNAEPVTRRSLDLPSGSSRTERRRRSGRWWCLGFILLSILFVTCDVVSRVALFRAANRVVTSTVEPGSVPISPGARERTTILPASAM